MLHEKAGLPVVGAETPESKFALFIGSLITSPRSDPGKAKQTLLGTRAEKEPRMAMGKVRPFNRTEGSGNSLGTARRAINSTPPLKIDC